MWTPKRIMLLLAGLSLFLIGYFVYALFLGGIDGLPPLPVAYLPGNDNDRAGPAEPVVREADKKLKVAFGSACEELNRAIKVELRTRGLVIATDQFNIMSNDKHRVQMVPFSAAIFGKSHGEDDFPEINTIQSDEAFLIFDRPIENMLEIGDRKVIGAELRGKKILLINNRHTPEKNDDIEVRPGGPLFYSEKDGRIWCDDWVKFIETHPNAEPTDVFAQGMDLYLNKETVVPKSKGTKESRHAAKAQNKNIGGVQKLVLRSYVNMHFHVDAHSGFLGSSGPPDEDGKSQPKSEPKAKTAKADNAKPSHVNIVTNGPFTFWVEKDLAVFESPEPAAAAQHERQSSPGQTVHVVRATPQPNGATLYDMLDCDRLELQFRKRKEVEEKGKPKKEGGDREIESAHATVRPRDPKAGASSTSGDDRVVLVVGSEALDAHCDELVYHCATKDRGPETILRGLNGQSMWANKDLHRITAQEVQLIAANRKGEGQYVFARGPGQLDLVDDSGKAEAGKAAEPGKVGQNKMRKTQYHAVWDDSLVAVKDKEGSKLYDLLTFTGNAGFIDDLHMQELHAKKLMVWLEQPERLNAEPPASKDKAANTPRQQPHKLEGFERVWAKSPDLNVKDSDYLVIRFKNEPGAQLPDNSPGVVTTPDGKISGPGVLTKVGSSPVETGFTGQPAGKQGILNVGQSTNEKDPAKKQNPINLVAKRVAVTVKRTGAKNELDEVVTEGNVYVQQDAANPKEKGIKIVGDILHVNHYADGDVMVVFGDAVNHKKFAQLELGDQRLVGPEITINQRDNTAEVKGEGAMTMPSGTNFDGSKSTKAGVELTVLWKDEMFFNGKDATFVGNVSAYQEESRLLCQTLYVYLDKMVSFKETERKKGDKGEGAKVERLMASGKFVAEDLKRDEQKKFLRYDRMVGVLLTIDNTEDRTNVSGPGRVDSLQQGSMADDGKAGKGSAKQEMYLTRIEYMDRLFSNKEKDGRRLVKFSGNVEVYHVPSNDSTIALTPDKMPKGGMYMRSDKMEVYSKPLPANKIDPSKKAGPEGNSTQEMHAFGNVKFKDGDVEGNAPIMHYNQETETIILEGTVSNRAVLLKSRGVGVPPERLAGTSLIYYRKTGLLSLHGVNSFQGAAK